jgi:ElaB/YqjD/DUF883 family membrane-anchored ribosome-binding protein
MDENILKDLNDELDGNPDEPTVSSTIKDHHLWNVVDDVCFESEKWIRKHPAAGFAMGVGLGIVVGWFLHGDDKK